MLYKFTTSNRVIQYSILEDYKVQKAHCKDSRRLFYDCKKLYFTNTAASRRIMIVKIALKGVLKNGNVTIKH